MGGCHHRLDGHEFEQAPGVGGRQGSLACCSSWGHKESGTTERLSNNHRILEPGTGIVSGVKVKTVCFVLLDLNILCLSFSLPMEPARIFPPPF